MAYLLTDSLEYPFLALTKIPELRAIVAEFEYSTTIWDSIKEDVE